MLVMPSRWHVASIVAIGLGHQYRAISIRSEDEVNGR